VLFEYQRQKWKEADKSQKEHKEKMAIMENARLEREVSEPTGTGFACVCVSGGQQLGCGHALSGTQL
jgi:hypothetical protein